MSIPTILACTGGSLYAGSIYQNPAWAASRLCAGIHVFHVIEREEQLAPRDLSGSLGFQASSDRLEELISLDESHARVLRLRGAAIPKNESGSEGSLTAAPAPPCAVGVGRKIVLLPAGRRTRAAK